MALCLSALSLAACGPQWTTYVDGLRKEMGTDSIRCAERCMRKQLTSAVHRVRRTRGHELQESLRALARLCKRQLHRPVTQECRAHVRVRTLDTRVRHTCNGTHNTNINKQHKNTTHAHTHSITNPSLDPINASQYYFPKKGPARKIIYAPKWEQDRYRNYKQRPATPMRHVLKPPSEPRGLILSWNVPEGMDFAYEATVIWQAPASTGQSNITHFLISKDEGLSWKELPGGGLLNQTVVKGLTRGQRLQVHIRAVNAVGPGPVAKISAYNRTPISYRERKKTDHSKFEDRALPLAKARTKPTSVCEAPAVLA